VRNEGRVVAAEGRVGLQDNSLCEAVLEQFSLRTKWVPFHLIYARDAIFTSTKVGAKLLQMLNFKV